MMVLMRHIFFGVFAILEKDMKLLLNAHVDLVAMFFHFDKAFDFAVEKLGSVRLWRFAARRPAS